MLRLADALGDLLAMLDSVVVLDQDQAATSLRIFHCTGLQGMPHEGED
jgi:hypothetical protein